MHGSYLNSLFILALLAGMVMIPVSAETSLTSDDSKLLTDITNEGIPLLYEIPGALKTGFFQGADNAIPTVGQEQTAALDAFLTKINAYSLSDDVKAVRDQYLASAEVYKKDLTEYGTLVNTCGSCVSKMNEMYPQLKDEANKTTKVVISFYQKSQAPVS